MLKCTASGQNQREVAIKIIKNKPAYFQQGLVEVRILQTLNKSFDLRIVKMMDYFVFRKHLCIVFELLSVNLYDVIKHNSFRGLPFPMVRSIVDQLTRCLVCLKLSNIIHCDLKPENILLMSKKNTKIKLIDFGSASFAGQQVYTYIQSRFYRSVDVILGISPFTTSIDMWSLGCIIVELFIGLPVFPGHSEYDQLSKITELLGPVPSYLLDKCKNCRKFFSKIHLSGDIEDSATKFSYRLRSREEYEGVTGKTERLPKKHIKATSLRELIMSAPIRGEPGSIEEENLRREKILSLVSLCLEYDPEKRLSPAQAVSHPLFDDICTLEELMRWKPKSDEACTKRLVDDPTSFVHTSSSNSSIDTSGISVDNVINTPVKQSPKPPSLSQPLQPRNSQSVMHLGIGGFCEESMPVSYRPALHAKQTQQSGRQKDWSSPSTKLPPATVLQASPTTVYRGGGGTTSRGLMGIPFSPNTSYASPGAPRARAYSETELISRWV